MADRNRYDRARYRDRDRAPDYDVDRSYRQEDQFSSGNDYAPTGYDTAYGQMGENSYARDEYQDEPRFESGWDRNDRFPTGRGYARQSREQPAEYRAAAARSGYGQEYAQPSRRYSSFTSTGYGAAPAGSYGGYRERNDDGFASPRYSDPRRERDWWDRTTDEIASWFGDNDAQRRRERDHRGRGPSDYTRSDERIREDVNDNLTNDWAVDARKVRVKVENGEVTLDGTVSTRLQKRRAEDCAEDVSGVSHVQNNLRVATGEVTERSEFGASPVTASSATSSTDKR